MQFSGEVRGVKEIDKVSFTEAMIKVLGITNVQFSVDQTDTRGPNRCRAYCTITAENAAAAKMAGLLAKWPTETDLEKALQEKMNDPSIQLSIFEIKSEKEEIDPEEAKLEAALSSAILSVTPNIAWDDVAGLEGAKALLKEAVILPIKFPQLFTGKRQPWRGILLYGPPGTGKSYLAQAVATEFGNELGGECTFMSVSSSDLVSKFQGESERLVKQLFAMARAKKPTIVFIDEIDSLCSARGDGENESARRIKTEFLVQMQGVGNDNDGVLVLGATNVPWELDPAIRRRFQKRVYISLPDGRARAHMFKVHVGKTPHSLTDNDFMYLGKATDGFTGSDIQTCVRDALFEPIRTCQVATHFKKVADPSGKQEFLWEPCSSGDPSTSKKEIALWDIPGEKLKAVDLIPQHFMNVVANAKPSVAPEDLVRQVEWTEMFGLEG